MKAGRLQLVNEPLGCFRFLFNPTLGAVWSKLLDQFAYCLILNFLHFFIPFIEKKKDLMDLKDPKDHKDPLVVWGR